MGAENNIDKAVTLLKLLHHFRLLHHAAAETDYHMGILLFQAVQIAQPSVNTLICILADCAGIIKNKVGFLALPLRKSGFQEDSHQLFRIMGVHLASEG